MGKENLEVLDLDANHYIKHSILQNSLAQEILESFQVDSDANILDIGCGDGRITAELARLAKKGKVTGVDASKNMIEFARKRFLKAEFPNLDFIKGMAESIELHKAYDLIVSFSCFHWLKDPKLVTQRLSASLKKGGKFLILTYPKESQYYRYLQTALRDYPKYYRLSANHSMLSASDYKKLLLENRLEILDFQQQDLVASYKNPEEIQEYIKGWLNSYVPLPKHLYVPFLQSVVHEILKDSAERYEDKINISYTALIIKAIKS
ncbi:MAG: methyltransferase domain-containing protein [Verrucomicrobia bacterium]|nr:methyltransferase domain-containing protein [Verrucomicrobiota bacterium]